MIRWWPLLVMGCSKSAELPSGSDAHTDFPHADGGSDGSGNSSETGGADTGVPQQPPRCVGPNPAPLGSETCVNQAACQWTGDQYYGSLGYAIDFGGDIDGDGLTDMLVGAYLEDKMAGDSVASVDVGRAHIWLGSDLLERMEPRATIHGSEIGSHLGYAVSIAPDINGDGLDDLLIGGRGTSIDGVTAVGEVQLVLGRTDGWDEVTADRMWTGVEAYDRLGSTLLGAGDLNGDGLGDLLISTQNRQISSTGREYSGRGAVLILNGNTDITQIAEPATADGQIDGSGSSSAAGFAIAVGDINGDGHPDLAVGAPYGGSNAGSVSVFLGGTDGFSGQRSMADAPITFAGPSYGSAMGYSLAIADLNGDGAAELVAGAPLASESFSKAGAVYVYTGSAAFFDAEADAATVLSGEFDDHQFGADVTAGPDLNGDTHPDLIVGAIYAHRGLVTKGGRVYGFLGPFAEWGTAVAAQSAPIQIFGASVKDYLGRASDAADLDGDGKAELVTSTGYKNDGENIDAGGIYLFWGE